MESVLKFSINHDVEILVVDDGSTDSTPIILEQFKNVFRVISTQNLGEASAVNVGIANAKNDILLVVSADDPLFTSRIFDDVVIFFAQNPNAVALYCDWRMIDEHDEILEYHVPGKYSEQELIGNFRCQPGPGTFFRRDSAIRIGGRSQRWKFVSDYDFYLRLSRLGDFGYRNETLAQWRRHAESTSISQRGLAMAQERCEVVERFVETESLPIKLRRDALSSAYLAASQLSFYSDDVPGKFYLWKAFWVAKGLPNSEFCGRSRFLKLVIFVLFTPFSRKITSFIRKSDSKWRGTKPLPL